jgi:alpha-tubulin suppressor-like RCC1 family protein
MASVITLEKVKLVYKGNYSSSTTYSAGDIVNLVSDDSAQTTKLFIYKNNTPKTGSHPYLNVITGTVASLGARTNSVTITLTNNPGGNFDYYVTPDLTYFYSKYFTGDTRVRSKTYVSSTRVTLTLSNYSNNITTITNSTATIGTRRIGNRYDRAFNTVDWDVYSESSRFRGQFSTTSNYDVGDIVAKNNQSYICIAPVGYGGGTVGPSSTTPTVDPEYDYLGCWDNYLTGSTLKHQRAIGFPNKNPFNWKGHPFISPPTWGNTGIGSYYQGGIPWTLQSNFKDNPNAWRWSMGTHAKDESYGSLFVIDGEGRSLSVGGLSNNGIYGSNAGGSSNSFGLASEGDSPANNSYWTNDSSAYGNELFDLNNLTRPRNFPRIVQYIKTPDNRIYLLSNGTVAVSGRMASLASHGQNADYSTNTALEIPRSSFKNRSIVKVSCSSNQFATDAYSWAMALDEYGEVWTWGENGVGQLGFANEQINRKETLEGLVAGSMGGHEYDVSGGGNRTLYAPQPLPCQFAFAGARIVDIWCGLYSAYALDEFGWLWSWGYNQKGQLGYPTNSGFRAIDRSQAPRKITSPLGYTWTGAALGGTITQTATITTISTGLTYTKTGATNNSWDAQVYSSVGYASSVAVSARCNSTTTRAMFGLNSDTTDVSYGSIDFAWYFDGGGGTVCNIYENGTNVPPAQLYPYTTNTVLSIVYDDDEGYVNYYYDYDGDGKYVQLMRRVLKTDVGGNLRATPLYFDSSFYNTNSNLTNIQITDTINQNTWNTFGGIQKFGTMHSNTSTSVDTIALLDGQGNVWTTGYNPNGETSDGTTTDNNNTSSLRKRKFGSSGIAGNINNFWMVNYAIYFSVRSSASTHNDIWGVGYNNYYQLTTGNTTSQTTPVQIKGSMSRTDNGVSSSQLQDIVTIVSGGSQENVNQNTVILGLDINGYVYASGFDRDGASGAIADGADNVAVSNNASKMQQFGGNSNSWVRLYMPNTQQGSCIDIFSTGCYLDYDGVNSTTYSHSAFLMSDGALLTCGSNVFGSRNYGYFPGQGQSMRTPVYSLSLPGN